MVEELEALSKQQGNPNQSEAGSGHQPVSSTASDDASVGCEVVPGAAVPIPSPNGPTMCSLLKSFGGSWNSELPPELKWPPDVFVVVASILKFSGAYSHVLAKWPPKDSLNWKKCIKKIGKAWTQHAVDMGPLPTEIQTWWQTVHSHPNAPIGDLLVDFPNLCESLLQLLAAADQASAGAGISTLRESQASAQLLPGSGASTQKKGDNPGDRFWLKCMLLLENNNSLTVSVLPSIGRALPKQHTPSSGLSLNSLTHHLAFHRGYEVVPTWWSAPTSTPITGSMNVVLAPWPLQISPTAFKPESPEKGQLVEMDSRFGFFRYEPPEDDPKGVVEYVRELVADAKRSCKTIHGVIFPETALSETEFQRLRHYILKEENAFLIAGVHGQAKLPGDPSKNMVYLDVPHDGNSDHEPAIQKKHHRWRLNLPQIRRYGLSGMLDPAREWWEHSEVGQREVFFNTLNKDLVMCCLVCEDLARQEPVADLVRAVGPNLVVALLMDGPQLQDRWPAHYATVLADDPGSSVLTLTCAGMVDLYDTPPGRRSSRSVALWKDSTSPTIEIELKEGASGVLLNLFFDHAEEWSADGRSDGNVASYPRLANYQMLYTSKVGR